MGVDEGLRLHLAENHSLFERATRVRAGEAEVGWMARPKNSKVAKFRSAEIERTGTVQALSRGLSVLEALALSSARGSGVTDVASHTGLSISTCHRLLTTLSRDGLCHQGKERASLFFRPQNPRHRLQHRVPHKPSTNDGPGISRSHFCRDRRDRRAGNPRSETIRLCRYRGRCARSPIHGSGGNDLSSPYLRLRQGHHGV